MAVTIDRGPYNALVDDSGAGLDGSPWDKAAIKTVLLDPIDGALAAVGTSTGSAPIDSPVFTGDPKAPTPTPGDNDTSIATTAYVNAAIAAAVPARMAVSIADGGQTIANATFVALIFNSETYDIGNLHDLVITPERITIPAGGAGFYIITGAITWAGSAAGNQRQGGLSRNGAGFVTNIVAPSAAYNPQNVVTTVAQLNVGDYLTFTGYQDSGASLTCTAVLVAVRI